MLTKEDKIYYAGLWRKFVKMARFQGAGRWSPDHVHKHLGVAFSKSGVADEKFLEEYIYPFVQYCHNLDKDDADAYAMCSLLNHEEIRKVAHGAYAMTNTYAGTSGLRSSKCPATLQHQHQDQLIADIESWEFDE